MTIEQMTLDGGGVAYKDAKRLPRLTQHQKAILQVVAMSGRVTVASAGVAIHLADGRSCAGIRGLPEAQEQPCCEYARDRGWTVCMQLKKRGILKSIGRGEWALAER